MSPVVPAQRREPVVLHDAADDIAAECTGCAAKIGIPVEPTSELLSSVQAFVAEHAPCVFQDR